MLLFHFVLAFSLRACHEIHVSNLNKNKILSEQFSHFLNIVNHALELPPPVRELVVSQLFKGVQEENWFYCFTLTKGGFSFFKRTQ